MNRTGSRCMYWLALTAFATAATLPAFAQSESGAADSQRGAIPRHSAPQYDDAFVPVNARALPGPNLPDPRDTVQEALPPAPTLALSEQLSGLDAQLRANAEIELEFGRDATNADRTAGIEIATLWNSGQYERALEQLRSLEASGVPLAMGIAWREPLPPGGLRVADVRVGGTRAEAQTMNLDFDAQTGNLFTIVRWGTTTGTSAWTMNTSSNGGLTWSETYAFPSSAGLIDVDLAVVDDYVYVAYVAGNATSEARLRRCLVSTGAVDLGFGFQVVFDAGANAIEEVALVSNADDFDNRIYYAAIQSNDTLRYAWDVATDGTTFTDESPATSNPEFGLDATWGNHRTNCSELVYFSYSGSDGHAHVMGKADPTWTDWIIENGAGAFRTTAISAYEDAIICAFEYPYPDGTGIRYRISYDCGASWAPGTIAVPDGATVAGYFEPDVDARDGDGTAITYQAEAGALDPMYYRTRASYAPGVWSDPTVYSDHDVFTGSDTALAHVPPLAGEVFSHGALYISLDPDNRTLYYDRPSAAGAPCADTTPPLIEIDLPATLSCACDLVQITGSVGDPDGTYAGDRLEYRRRDAAAWIVADTATGARAGVLYTWDTSALPQDFYYVRIVGRNECALSASDSTFIFKPTTFGTLELRAPADGGIYGGVVCVDGTAWSQSCFDRYTVDYKPLVGGVFAPVDPPSSPYGNTVLNDPLASWNTAAGPTAVADGNYQVRLQGANDCGDMATVIHTIRVDNTVPTAEITVPRACEIVSGVVRVVGTARDANLQSWSLSYTGGDASGWVPVNAGNASVVNGVLGDWDTRGLRTCAYTLRLTVADQANVSCSGDPHRTDYYVSVRVGPDCPTDLNGDGETSLEDLAMLLSAFGTMCP
ncbi:MAG: hypothetical protein AMXMBFR47_38390 [Planctomycetota bacterium]